MMINLYSYCFSIIFFMIFFYLVWKFLMCNFLLFFSGMIMIMFFISFFNGSLLVIMIFFIGVLSGGSNGLGFFGINIDMSGVEILRRKSSFFFFVIVLFLGFVFWCVWSKMNDFKWEV